MGKENYNDDDLGTSFVRLADISVQGADEQGGLTPAVAVRRYPVQNLPVYYALSYTWGPPFLGSDQYAENEKASIRFNGEPFDVSPNLYDALLQLYESYRGVLFWIDNVCINQARRPEREAQVGIMDQIYRQAEKVIIWLGQGKPGIQKGLNLVRLYARVGLPNLLQAVDMRKSGAGDWGFDMEKQDLLDHFGLPPLSREDAWALLEVYRSRWYHRIWILQEVALATEAWVHWGGDAALWDDIGYAAAFIQLSTLAGAIVMDFIDSSFDLRVLETIGEGFLGAMRIQLVREFCRKGDNILKDTMRFFEFAPGITAKSGSNWLFKLVLWTRVSFQAGDKRDGVYGFLGILNHIVGREGVSKRLMPDYASSVEQVMHKVAVDLMDATQSLQLLGLVCDPTLREVGVTPSWVPDLSPGVAANPIMGPCHKGLVEGDLLFHASSAPKNALLEKSSFLVQGNKLHVQGQRVGAVRERGEDMDEMLCGRLDGWAKLLLQMNPTYEPASTTRGDAFRRTIVMDQDLGRDHRPASLETLFQLQRALAFPIFAAFRRSLEADSPVDIDKFLHGYDSVFNAEKEVEDCPLPSKRMIEEFCIRHEPVQSNEASAMPRMSVEDSERWNTVFRRTMSTTGVLLTECLGQRRPFLLESGHVGCGPKSIQEGDEVWILSGCPTPMVLRASPGEKTYCVIGEAYVHGIMHGEFVSKGLLWEDLCLV